MPTCTADTATAHVYAYKAGLLSAVGHDVLLAVSAFTIDINPDEPSIQATFNPASVTVVNAIANGIQTPDALSKKDRGTINTYVQKDILHTKRHTKIAFTSTDVFEEDGQWEIEGDLTVHGTTRSISLVANVEGEHLVGEFLLNQPSYGIKPFSAMLGALKVKPDVRIVVRIPVSALAPA